MAKLSRWKQLIFGKTGNTSEFGKIGSDTIGSPENTKDPATIQSLAGYLSGLFAITNSGVEAPRLEDLNSLFFIITSQLAYLMEAGVPEWLATQEYWIGSRARIGQKVYMSLTGEGEAPNVGNNPASDAINWRDLDAYYRNAANLLGTLPLARLPTVLTGKKASTAEVADAAVKLLTAITIGGVSFDGSAPINLPGVNIAGNQNTTGNAATATYATSAGNSGACSGNAATATKLAMARTILLTGGATGSTTFDGSENKNISVTVRHVTPYYLHASVTGRVLYNSLSAVLTDGGVLLLSGTIYFSGVNLFVSVATRSGDTITIRGVNEYGRLFAQEITSSTPEDLNVSISY